MAKPDLKVLNLLCPHRACGAAMVQDECGIFCRACGYEAITWADPVDADVPMNILVAREQTEARRKVVWRGAMVAAILLAVACASWMLWPSAPVQPRSPATMTLEELRFALSKNALPSDIAFPGHFHDPDLFLLPKSRFAQSELVVFWQQLSTENKRELLELIKQADDVLLLPLVAEITWFTSPTEQDEAIARSLMDAAYLGSRRHLDLVEFLMRHVASTTLHAEVRSDATEFAAHLVERRNRLGR